MCGTSFRGFCCARSVVEDVVEGAWALWPPCAVVTCDGAVDA